MVATFNCIARKQHVNGGRRFILFLLICGLVLCLFNILTVINSHKTTSFKKSVHISSLPPVHIDSSWIGNQWIPPPGYRLYNTQEIQSYFRRHSILFVGDSTARRTYATMYGILNATENQNDVPVLDIDAPSVIDVNRKRTTRKTEFCFREGYELCRSVPLSSNHYDWLDVHCMVDIANIAKSETSMLKTEWIQNYTLVIFVMGPHEVLERSYCRASIYGRKNQTDEFFQKLLQVNDINDSNTSFVWKTWGSPVTANSNDDEKLWNKARAHNEYVKMKIDNDDMSRWNSGYRMSVVSYVDWGQAMLPRLYPKEKRIAGDINAHYGLEARLTFVQMLMNHLVERDRQRDFKLQPWVVTKAGNNYYSDPEHFMQ